MLFNQKFVIYWNFLAFCADFYLILGNLYELSFLHPHPDNIGAFDAWKKKYGAIYTWWLGPEPVVSLSNFELINELIVKDASSFSGRFLFDKMNEHLKGEFSVINVKKIEKHCSIF